MKRTLLAFALATAAGSAGAQESLEPVIVEHVDGYQIVENCTPPASTPECAGFHAMIRQNFSDREIGMLFGAATSYPEYRTSYSQVRERYDNLVRYVEDYGVTPVARVSVGTINTIPVAPAVYAQTTATHDEPQRNDVLVDDANAIIVADDPDAVILSRASIDDEPYNTDEHVVYYDDDDSLPQRQ